MAFEWLDSVDGRVLSCSGDLGPVECSELHRELVHATAVEGAIAIDLSRVTEAGTMAIQLVLSAQKTASDLGKAFRLTHPSQCWTSACERASLRVEG